MGKRFDKALELVQVLINISKETLAISNKILGQIDD